MTTRPTRTPANVTAVAVHISLDHPRLIRTEPASIRSLFRRYDQYSTTIIARAKRLTDKSLTQGANQLVELNFCDDAEWLESHIPLDFITETEDYASLTDEIFRPFLEKRWAESKKTISLEKFDKIVKQKLRINMANHDAEARMEDLFNDYHTLLSRNGLAWLIKNNRKVSVQHVLSAIRQKTLFDRLTSDLEFGEYHLRKDFNGFLKHVIELAKDLQIVDAGPTRSDEPSDQHNHGGGSCSGSRGSESGRGCRG